MDDGIIELGTERAEELGFTPDKFDGWLWKIDNSVWRSMVISKHEKQGNTQALITAIRKAGYTVKVPTPLGSMLHILNKLQFTKTTEDTEMGDCEVWVLGG